MTSPSRTVDLRSDTFTLPSAEMYNALSNASLGDDIYEEDTTVHDLERRAAELTGKDAALLVSSGTQGNLVSLMAVGARGDEVLLGRRSDLYNSENGSVACIAGLFPRTLLDDEGWVSPEDVVSAIRPQDVHFGRTRILVLENSHQWSGGTPIPLAVLEQHAEICRKEGLHLHMDGARLFNAATAQNLPATEIARFADSVTFCLSKGLSCPIGSMVCGDADFVGKARLIRKMLGGGMRQAGWIAAAGLVGLTEGVNRLNDDHKRAKALAEGLAAVKGIVVDVDRVNTNIIIVSTQTPMCDVPTFKSSLLGRGVKCFGMGPGRLRFVVHRMIDDADIEYVINCVSAISKFGAGPAGGDLFDAYASACTS